MTKYPGVPSAYQALKRFMAENASLTREERKELVRLVHDDDTLDHISAIFLMDFIQYFDE